MAVWFNLQLRYLLLAIHSQAGPLERVYTEVSTIAGMQFRFQQPKDPVDWVEELATDMQR